MKKQHFKIITVIILIIELVTLAYLAFMAYWLSVWFIDDSLAFSIEENEWTKIAIFRIFQISIVAFIYSGITYLLNRYLFRKSFNISKKKILILSILIFLSILIPSIIGGIQFAIEKPFF